MNYKLRITENAGRKGPIAIGRKGRTQRNAEEYEAVSKVAKENAGRKGTRRNTKPYLRTQRPQTINH